MRNWKLGDRGRGVRYVQEWLCLDEALGVDVVPDGHYGVATEFAVRRFQRIHGLQEDGIAGSATWAKLTHRLDTATAALQHPPADFGQAVIACAEQHLAARAREVGHDNLGPWVRLYMRGDEGKSIAWCAGFATYCLHQAAASLGRKPPLPRCSSVGQIVRRARRRGRFIATPKRSERKNIKPGSLFVARRGRGWHHVGIVTEVHDDVFLSIEGNSNDESQNNSFEVCRRIRSYEFETKDFIRVD
ncbi:MAG TPA: peptidoglycan-binding protein [Thermoanaerobaculia bacterium]|jgi:peptidoglycan hydrolase-like protein with peptidoglycan-binding domain